MLTLGKSCYFTTLQEGNAFVTDPPGGVKEGPVVVVAVVVGLVVAVMVVVVVAKV